MSYNFEFDREIGDVEQGRVSSDYYRSLTGIKILVLDDSPESLYLLGSILTYAGANVFLAQTVSTAWDFLVQNQAQILISDLAMPDQDGLRFIQSLRAHEKAAKFGSIPAIAVTGLKNKLIERLALESGFQECLEKPIKKDTLIESVLNTLTPARAVIH